MRSGRSPGPAIAPWPGPGVGGVGGSSIGLLPVFLVREGVADIIRTTASGTPRTPRTGFRVLGVPEVPAVLGGPMDSASRDAGPRRPAQECARTHRDG